MHCQVKIVPLGFERVENNSAFAVNWVFSDPGTLTYSEAVSSYPLWLPLWSARLPISLRKTTKHEVFFLSFFTLTRNWCLSQHGAVRLFSVFIALNWPWLIKLSQHCPAAVHCIEHRFFNFVGSLVPRPNTTVICLGVKIVHKQNYRLANDQPNLLSNCTVNCKHFFPPLICPAVVGCCILVDPLSGQVELTNITFGSTANYTCNQRYILSNGNSTRTCEANGYWSGSLPSCECEWTCLKLKAKVEG